MDKTMPTFHELGWGFFLRTPYWSGWLAVNLFFVLSGFVLFLPYAGGQRKLAERADFKTFYQHRAGRLLPLFYFNVLICTLLVQPFGGAVETLKELAFVCTGVFSFTTAHFWPQCNTVLWSLGVEIWFCVLFPLIAFGILKLGFKRTVLACMLVALADRLLSIYLLRNNWTGDFHIAPFKDGVFGRVDDFVAGMAVAAIYVQGRCRSLAWTYGAFLGGCALVWGGMILWNLERCEILPGWSRAFFNIPLNVGFAGILLAVVNGNLPKLLNRFFQIPLLQLAGVMCYSLYVWHFVVFQQFTQRRHEWPILLTSLALIFILALLSFRYIEFGNVKDLKKLLPMFFPTPEPVPPAGGPTSPGRKSALAVRD